ncbi:Putative surface protein bspA-like [Papilio machaon]|uniref:Putative surface protein bspA-like n=1 Tax=Papilio machaon TaxID=76193 RepID=A0A0N0PEK0_PAPMA|nr:Putative surface protein bspA-like [Papilio machaon]
MLFYASVALLACLGAFSDAQYVKTVKGGHGGGGHQYYAGDNLVKYFGNRTQHGYELTSPVNYDVGVCYIEVPTASLVMDQAHVPAGNGSRPNLSRIKSCCRGYVRNIYNSRLCDPVCSQECVNALCTAPDTCTCFPDHVKNVAGFCIPTCPIGCQNGHCSGGECICKEGYKLDVDSKYCLPDCKENCGGIGNCTAPNTCECKTGYQATAQGSCKPTCNLCRDGDCVAPNECRCHQGFVKDDKGQCIPQCDQGCGSNGRCIAPNVCAFAATDSSTIRPGVLNQHGQYPNQPGYHPGHYPGQPGYPYQPGYRPGQQPNRPDQSNNLPNHTGIHPDQQGQYPGQSGQYPNQPGYRPGQQPNQPGYQQGQKPNQPGYQIGQQTNQSALYPDRPGQYPSQPGQHPNQYPNQPGQYPNQPGQYPNQPGQYPNQPGQYPDQSSQYPTQSRLYPNLPGQPGQTLNQTDRPNQPDQYPYQGGHHSTRPDQHSNLPDINGPRDHPNQYPNQPNQYPYQPGYHQSNQYPIKPGQFQPQPGPYPFQPGQSPNQNMYTFYPGQDNRSLYPDSQHSPDSDVQVMCSVSCINGYCVEGNRCGCNRGYILDKEDPTGTRCIPHCPGGCPNGVCSGPNFCICNMGYYKDHSVKGKAVCIKRIREVDKGGSAGISIGLIVLDISVAGILAGTSDLIGLL